MPATENKIGVIILAAGASSRLGQPKQLLEFNGQTLIRRAVETAIRSDAANVSVVLGAEFERIKTEIQDLNCRIIFNENWTSGMGGSIKIGLEKLLENAPDISAVIISLCDQPLIENAHLNRLIEEFYQTGKPVVAAFYENKCGVPALFAREKFAELMKVEGDRGARDLFYQTPEKVVAVEFPEAVFDVDTLSDYENLLTISKR